MEEFIDASSVKEKADMNKINMFISKFNHTIIIKGKLTLNDSLDKIPTLSDSEFSVVEEMAKEKGWILTRFNDNNSSITYKVEKLKN